jgi:hypothetical protein
VPPASLPSQAALPVAPDPEKVRKVTPPLLRKLIVHDPVAVVPKLGVVLIPMAGLKVWFRTVTEVK